MPAEPQHRWPSATGTSRAPAAASSPSTRPAPRKACCSEQGVWTAIACSRLSPSAATSRASITSLKSRTLAASASYIAAPAAVRIALPAASPAIYLTSSLAVTFPFNVVVGIPLYFSYARWLVPS